MVLLNADSYSMQDLVQEDPSRQFDLIFLGM